MAFPGVRSTPKTLALLSKRKYPPVIHNSRSLIEFAVAVAMSSISSVNMISIRKQRVLCLKQRHVVLLPQNDSFIIIFDFIVLVI